MNVLKSGSIIDPKASTTFRGQWELKSEILRQTDAKATGRLQFGDYGWSDYTFALKARRLSDTGGFAIIVRNSDGGSYLQWNLGGKENNQFALQANLASHSEEKNYRR